MLVETLFFPANQRKKTRFCQKNPAHHQERGFFFGVFGLAEKRKTSLDNAWKHIPNKKCYTLAKKKWTWNMFKSPLWKGNSSSTVSFLTSILVFRGVLILLMIQKSGKAMYTSPVVNGEINQHLFTIDRRRISASTTGIGSSKPARWGSCWICVGFLSVFFSVATGWNLSEFSCLDGNDRNYQPKSHFEGQININMYFQVGSLVFRTEKTYLSMSFSIHPCASPSGNVQWM